MNLYDLHPDPEGAPGYGTRHDTVPELVWERYKHYPEELKKREAVLAREAVWAYAYACDILRGPFPAGEPAIARDAWYSYCYAKNILKGAFPAAEALIAKDAQWAYAYAYLVQRACAWPAP